MVTLMVKGEDEKFQRHIAVTTALEYIKHMKDKKFNFHSFQRSNILNGPDLEIET